MGANATERNHAMEEYVRAALPDGDYVPRLVADDIVATLLTEDRELLEEWLLLHAGHLVARIVQSMRAADRARMRNSGQATFAAAAAAFAGGDEEPLRNFLDTVYYAVEGSVTRRLGDMTADDCEHVAAKFQRAAATYDFESVFMGVLARKCRRAGLSVRDVVTHEQILSLRNSLTSTYSGMQVA
jgi:hypothetical protein